VRDELFEMMTRLPEGELLKIIDGLPASQREQLLMIASDLQTALTRENGQKSFMSFVKTVWPSFIAGRHHAVMAQKFEEIASGN